MYLLKCTEITFPYHQKLRFFVFFRCTLHTMHFMYLVLIIIMYT